MNGAGTSRLRRGALRAVGVTAVATGLAVAARGTRAIPGGAPVSPSVDSALRFYAIWWAASGSTTWRLANSPEPDESALRTVYAVTFLGGLARVLAARQTGRPHPLFRVLTVLELWIPLLLAGRAALRLPPAAGWHVRRRPPRDLRGRPPPAAHALCSPHPRRSGCTACTTRVRRDLRH